MRSPGATSDQRFVEVLGSMDELNSRLGYLARHAGYLAATPERGQLLGLALDQAGRRVAAAGTDHVDVADLCTLFLDIDAVQTTLREHAVPSSSYLPSRVSESLARLRAKSSTEEVLDDTPAELCAAGRFDRAMISAVHGSAWSPRLLFLSDGPDNGFNRGLSDYIAELNITLASPMLEAEVVRRRLPALVQDVQNEPRTFGPLMAAARTREYVVAPIVANGTVIGLLHADAYVSRRVLTIGDRDCLRSFAEGVGVICERMVLQDRLQRQRECVDDTLRDVGAAFDGRADGPVQIPAPGFRSVAIPEPPEPADRAPGDVLASLTAREREVMDLLAGGATNAQVADRLTVAESTVKSHVKHILHKMGATNRAGAIARYMRAKRIERRFPV